ncbi:MAG: hypothetical protein GKR92_10195 [Gammaproteobacteria bacterium]|nr:MAG: hypothetical protein GKR92_10195 [Gammaproteobacteria bacterium]
MNKDLERILAWAKVHSPQTLQHLNSPASDDDIRTVETEIGIKLPNILKELLKQFDGEDGETWLALLGNGNQLLSCKRIIEDYKIGQEAAEENFDDEMDTVAYWKDRIECGIIFVKGNVKPLFLQPNWLPITCMNGDVYRYLDFDPAPGGTEGQVIEVDMEGCSYQVVADSLEEAFSMYADQLESGKYKVEEDGYIELIEVGLENELSWGTPKWLKDIK